MLKTCLKYPAHVVHIHQYAGHVCIDLLVLLVYSNAKGGQPVPYIANLSCSLMLMAVFLVLCTKPYAQIQHV